MDSESGSDFNNTEQIINEMLSFLNDSTEHTKQVINESKDTITSGIKKIIQMLPGPSPSASKQDEQGQLNYLKKNKHIENACRYKDPYLQEVNRLMFSSTIGHPTNNSPEYFQTAENYALYGKEFLDFPTDIKFPQPLDVSCFGDVSCSFPRPRTPQSFQIPTGQFQNLGGLNVPQLPLLMNPANYCSFPFYQTQNLIQPLMYSNPFLMTQYLNLFVRETQINTSIVQQQQFLTGGIQERLVYAQMLQQQIQTNEASLVNSCVSAGSSPVEMGKTKFQQDVWKINPNKIYDLTKTDLSGGS